MVSISLPSSDALARRLTVGWSRRDGAAFSPSLMAFFAMQSKERGCK
jgi:hypothetical protein